MLSREEELYYTRLAKGGDKGASIHLINCNLRLVAKIARRYNNRSRGLSLVDLIEEGKLGFIRAVEKYDLESGFMFANYATWWIRQSIESAIQRQPLTTRSPMLFTRESLSDINSNGERTIQKHSRVHEGPINTIGPPVHMI